jgi:acyl dehydratase
MTTTPPAEQRTQPRLDDLKPGDSGPQKTLALTRTEFVRYAGASLDLNPMHHDDTVATAAGMPSVFGHGMLTAGFLAGAVTDLVGLDALRRYEVRFTKQAWPGRELHTEIEVRDARREGSRTEVGLACRVVDDEGAEVLTATATASRVDDGSPLADKTGKEEERPAVPNQEPATVADLTGVRLPSEVIAIERGPVQNFAVATHNDDPVYRSVTEAALRGFGHIPVPPTYLFVANGLGAFDDEQPLQTGPAMTLVELIAALRRCAGGKGMILHGSQAFDYHDAVWVGDVLESEGYVEVAETKASKGDVPGMSVLVVRTDFRRRDNARPVATLRSTFLFRARA